MIRLTRRKVSLYLQVWFLLFPMLKPAVEACAVWTGYSIAYTINRFLWIWNLFSGLLIVTLLALRVVKNRHSVGLCVWLISALTIVYFIGSVSSGAFQSENFGIVKFIEIVGNPLFFIILADMYAKENFEWFIGAVYYYLMALSLFTSITIYIFYPKAMYAVSSTNHNYYLFGLDNVSFLYAMNSFIAGVSYYIRKKNKISFRFLALYIVIFGAYIYCKAGTATICIIFLALYYIIQKSRIIKKLNFQTSSIISLGGMLFIILFDNFAVFTGLLQLLGKNTTFSGRTLLWAAGIKMFPRHSIFGIGVSGDMLSDTIMSGGMASWGQGIGHMHNVLLEVLIKGGVVGICLFLSFFVFGNKKIKLNNDDKLAQSLYILLPILALAYSFEYRIEDITFWVLIIILHYGFNNKVVDNTYSHSCNT